ncbi:hypothetical protein D187_007975 [Cystobacter fuscus DSM 2262]|uniref:Uncharacterized protein n=1 Tax=Cystobacter fuscus (strain ATCC 25194 / DSM 2262 / NBRC 100088 / M29) TaxID=1242864 RepID=S9QJK1_CYSF2|nr:hypothetical protein D187_007975 [Cystobacter fuscus DSM 2262]
MAERAGLDARPLLPDWTSRKPRSPTQMGAFRWSACGQGYNHSNEDAISFHPDQYRHAMSEVTVIELPCQFSCSKIRAAPPKTLIDETLSFQSPPKDL